MDVIADDGVRSKRTASCGLVGSPQNLRNSNCQSKFLVGEGGTAKDFLLLFFLPKIKGNSNAFKPSWWGSPRNSIRASRFFFLCYRKGEGGLFRPGDPQEPTSTSKPSKYSRQIRPYFNLWINGNCLISLQQHFTFSVPMVCSSPRSNFGLEDIQEGFWHWTIQKFMIKSSLIRGLFLSQGLIWVKVVSFPKKVTIWTFVSTLLVFQLMEQWEIFP